MDVRLKLHLGFRRWALNYCWCEKVNCDLKKWGRAEYPGFIVTIRCQLGSLGLVWSAVHVKGRKWNSSFKWAISNLNLIGEVFFVPSGQGGSDCSRSGHPPWWCWDEAWVQSPPWWSRPCSRFWWTGFWCLAVGSGVQAWIFLKFPLQMTLKINSMVNMHYGSFLHCVDSL